MAGRLLTPVGYWLLMTPVAPPLDRTSCRRRGTRGAGRADPAQGWRGGAPVRWAQATALQGSISRPPPREPDLRARERAEEDLVGIRGAPVPGQKGR